MMDFQANEQAADSASTQDWQAPTPPDGGDILEALVDLRLREITVRDQIVALVRTVNERSLYRQGGFSRLQQFLVRELGYDSLTARQIAISAGAILFSQTLTSSDPQVQARIEALRRWRTDRARREQVAAYRIITNRTLIGLAEVNPLSLEAMQAVKGMGKYKIGHYGDEILSVLRGLPQAISRPDRSKASSTASARTSQASAISASVAQ